MKVLVTGGAGYIGSTICSALIDGGHTPVILDSLTLGREEFTGGRIFYKGDIADTALLEKIIRTEGEIRHVIHCAALTVVPDSVRRPFEYYYENVSKTNIMLKKLAELGCDSVVFSSSASVYGDSEKIEVSEEEATNPQSPYAKTKVICEMMMRDFATAYGMRAIAFRYFNVIGADPVMRTGPYNEAPTLLLPRLILFGKGQGSFSITGTGWPTRDGTGIRDYVHVWDIAAAHVMAVEKFGDIFAGPGFEAINLGCGRGVTVREFVSDFEAVIGRRLDIREAGPRPGDVAGAYTRIDKAAKMLGWRPKLSIRQAIEDNIKWFEMTQG